MKDRYSLAFLYALKRRIRWMNLAVASCLIILLFFIMGCNAYLGGAGDANSGKELYVGFAQVGHESDWRYAETKSVKEALCEENGIKLELVDCDNDFEHQRKVIYDFIEKGVDYLIIAPIVSIGWEDILKKAEDANIPVIVIDRTIDDSDNYATWIGSEFTDEGLAAGEWLKSYTTAKGIKEVNVVEISGNEGSSAENGRTAGFHKYIEYEGWNIIDSRDGEFTEEGGKRIMDFFCDEYEGQFNVIISQNDNMSFGIMQSLDEHGITYGVDGDVIIVSFDACTAGLKKVLEGKINADFQCNPLQGSDCLKLIRDMEAGKEIKRENIMSEAWYAAEDIVPEVTYFNSMGEEVTEPIVVVDEKAVEDAY